MYILYIWPLFWKSQKLMHAPIVVGRFPATWPGEKSPYLMGKWYKIHTHKLIHVWRILPPGTVFFPHCHAITSSLTQLIAAVPVVPLDPCHHRSAGRSLAPGVAGHGVLEGAQGQLFQVEERSRELDVLSTVPGRFQPKKGGWSVCWKMCVSFVSIFFGPNLKMLICFYIMEHWEVEQLSLFDAGSCLHHRWFPTQTWAVARGWSNFWSWSMRFRVCIRCLNEFGNLGLNWTQDGGNENFVCAVWLFLWWRNTILLRMVFCKAVCVRVGMLTASLSNFPKAVHHSMCFLLKHVSRFLLVF